MSLLTCARLDRRKFRRSPAESSILDHYVFNRSFLGAHDFVWAGSLGEGIVPPLADSSAPRRYLALLPLPYAYDYPRSRYSRGFDERLTGVLVSSFPVYRALDPPYDFRFILRNDA